MDLVSGTHARARPAEFNSGKSRVKMKQPFFDRIYTNLGLGGETEQGLHSAPKRSAEYEQIMNKNIKKY